MLRYGVSIFGNYTCGWHLYIDRNNTKGYIKKCALWKRDIRRRQSFQPIRMCNLFFLLKQTAVLKYYLINQYIIPRTPDWSPRVVARFVRPRNFTKYSKNALSSDVPSVFNGLPDSGFGITGKRRLRKALEQILLKNYILTLYFIVLVYA